jgi:hypothetical protein
VRLMQRRRAREECSASNEGGAHIDDMNVAHERDLDLYAYISSIGPRSLKGSQS